MCSPPFSDYRDGRLLANAEQSLSGGAVISDPLADCRRDGSLHRGFGSGVCRRPYGQSLPEFAARFILGWAQGMNRGEWDQQTGDLEALLGRTPTTTEQHLRQIHSGRA